MIKSYTEGSNEKNNSIEFLRFIFCVIIVYYHILHENIMDYIGANSTYMVLQGKCGWAGYIVECFLVIGGLYLYVAEQKKKERPFIERILDKFVRLWPVFAFYVLICVIFYKMKIEEAVFEVCFLHCTGISLNFKGIIWYIAPYFWASLLIMLVLRSFNEKHSTLILGLTCYAGYLININYCHGGFGRATINNLLSLGFVRVYSGIAFGVLLAIFLHQYENTFGKSLSKYKMLNTILYTFLEILCLATLVMKFLLGFGTWSNAFIIIILFSFLFVSFVKKNGIVSCMLDRKICGILGRYSYSIYVMQQISFYILRDTVWKNTSLLENHTYISLCISIVFSILVGVLTYHIIERPAIKLYQKWKDVFMRRNVADSYIK